MPLPGFALRLAFGEMATVLLDGQRALPQRLLDLGFAFRFPKLEAALQDLLG
jgi:NAD dependent epimerase/dehydratase family enzyme